MVLTSVSATVPASEVFPIERLRPELRARAEELLLAILDREGLFTVVGGMKPISSGWVREDTRAGLTAESVEQTREIMTALRVGDLVGTTLQPFHIVRDGRRLLEGVVHHRRSFAETVQRHRRFFAGYGITPSTPVGEAILAFEPDSSTGRFRAYGHLFGYPDYAVDFFVQASETQAADPEKRLVPRDFRQIPTFRLATGAFVYAVPKGEPERPVDRELRERAAPILAHYRRLRDRFVGPGRPGPAAMMREWMCRDAQTCSPEIAEEKARQSRS
ncbi:MAG: hypothetical protein MH204_06480 [Fimbriimonadaceae bacterium]|nr:hypothetical protein [Fimbriimonadaceae bacterium]